MLRMFSGEYKLYKIPSQGTQVSSSVSSEQLKSTFHVQRKTGQKLGKDFMILNQQKRLRLWSLQCTRDGKAARKTELVGLGRAPRDPTEFSEVPCVALQRRWEVQQKHRWKPPFMFEGC